MRFFAALFLLFTTYTFAITITVYKRPGCGGRALGACKNVGYARCCRSPIGFGSAKASGIAANALFGTFRPAKGSACGKVNAARRGAGCLTSKGGKSRGAAAVKKNAVNKRDLGIAELDNFECLGEVDANIAYIEGRSFAVNYDVPADHTAALFALAERDAKAEDIPAHLLEYEIDE